MSQNTPHPPPKPPKPPKPPTTPPTPHRHAIELNSWEQEQPPQCAPSKLHEILMKSGYQLPVRLVEIVFCSDWTRTSIRLIREQPQPLWVVHKDRHIHQIQNVDQVLQSLLQHWTQWFFRQVEQTQEPWRTKIQECKAWTRLYQFTMDDSFYWKEPDETDNEYQLFWSEQVNLMYDLFRQYDPLLDKVWSVFGLGSVRDHIHCPRRSSKSELSNVFPWFSYAIQNDLVRFETSSSSSSSSCSPSAASPATAASVTDFSSSSNDAINN